MTTLTQPDALRIHENADSDLKMRLTLRNNTDRYPLIGQFPFDVSV